MKTSELIQELICRLKDHGDQEVSISMVTKVYSNALPLVEVDNNGGNMLFLRNWHEDK